MVQTLFCRFDTFGQVPDTFGQFPDSLAVSCLFWPDSRLIRPEPSLGQRSNNGQKQ